MTTRPEGPGGLARRASADPGRPRPRPRAAAGPPGSGPERWQHRYAAAVRGVDLALLALCTGIGAAAAGGAHGPFLGLVTGITTAVLVGVALALARAWDARILGSGAEEYRRLARGVTSSGVVLAVGGLALHADAVRPWVFVVLPCYAGLAMVGRWLLRRRLHHRRRHGRCMLAVLAVGGHDAVAELIARTRRDTQLGWTVTGACTSTAAGPDGAPDIAGVPVVGDLETVNGAVRRTGYRIVAVAPGPGWGPRRLHELAWQLEGTDTELVADPGLTAMAGPRLHATPVADLPLVRLSRPQLAGGRRLLKNVLDRAGAAVLLLVLAPLLLGAAFAALVGGRGQALRRRSLRELTPLLDVLSGSRALVGRRPPHEPEDDAAGDRLLLGRPGVTGLWRVLPGAAHLGGEESILLDLRYVENWSVLLDLTILWRTVTQCHRGATRCG